MGLFRNNNGGFFTPRQQLESKFQTARTDLLLIVAFTVINLVLLVTGSDSYFVFSAFIPYSIGLLGMTLCGKLPIEYYEGEYDNFIFFGDGVFAGIIAVAVVLTLLYLLCWFLSKKHKTGWLIFALVMISIDTAILLLGGFTADMVIDLLFHVWMIVSIAMGVSATKKLKALPEDEPDFTDDTVLQESVPTVNGEPIDQEEQPKE